MWLLLTLLIKIANASGGLEPPVLRASLEVEPQTLDWNAARSSTDRYLVSYLMRGLLKYDARNEPVCDLCSVFTVSADGKTYRFELLKNETWSDGVSLEGKHFVDSFQRLLTPTAHFPAAASFQIIQGASQKGKWDPRKLGVRWSRSPEKSELEITLTQPWSLFLHLLTTPAVSPIRKELIEGSAKSRDGGENHASKAILGPYQLAAWERGKRIVIEGNPKYNGPRPVYRVDFMLDAHAALFAKFKAERIDLLAQPTGDDLAKLTAPNMTVSPYWATRLLVFNMRRPNVASAAFRRAILHGLDRDALPAFLKNGERRATGLIPPGLPGYRELPLATRDPALVQAAQAQAPAAWKVTPIDILAADLPADRKVAQWLQMEIEKLGWRARVIARPGPAFTQDLESGRYDLALTTWSFGMATPIELLRAFETGSVENRAGWTNVAFDAHLNTLTRKSTPGEFTQALEEMTQILEVKDPAAVPLGYPTQPMLLGRRVVNFAITPFGDPDLVRIQLKQ